MNSHTYLTISDLDSHILTLLDPGQILTLSEVNHHYNMICANQTRLLTEVKYNFYRACSMGSAWLIKWMRDKSKPQIWRKVGSHTSITHGFWIACVHVHEELIEWFVDNIDATFDKEFGPALVKVCGSADTHKVKKLIDIGKQKQIDYGFKFYDGFYAACVTNNDIDVAQLLLDNYHYADAIKHYAESILKIIFKNHLCQRRFPMIKWLFNLSKTYGYKINDNELIRYLVNKSFDKGLLDIAVWIMSLNDSEYRHQPPIDRRFIFQSACISGNIELCKIFISLPESKNEIGNMTHNNPHTVRQLIELCEDRLDPVVISDRLFDLAVKRADITMAELLLRIREEQNQPMNILRDNDYLFHWLCSEGQLRMAQWLLEVGERPGYCRTNRHPTSCFRSAYARDYIDVCQWLVSLEARGYAHISSKLAKKISLLTN